ncbi:polysaccharide biosynthesis/export family protein [Flavitalea flava]
MTPPIRLLVLIAFLTTAVSCTTYQKVPYMQDAVSFTKQKIPVAYQITIENDDLLSISVSSKDTVLAQPFNRAPGGHGYLVNQKGVIDFPVFGEIKVAGKTPIVLADALRSRIISEGYIKDPSVAVKLLNFKISVMGEVNKPGVYPIPSERVSILEALTLAGDMSVYGKRDKVLVIREEEGQRDMHYIDVNSTSLFNSPYYYLRQNDLVYVEPNKARAQQSEYNPRLPLILSAVSVLTSIASIIILITK